MCEERWCDLARQQAFEPGDLHPVMLATIRAGENATIEDARLLKCFGATSSSMRAGELWRMLAESLVGDEAPWAAPLGVILDHGTLATRIQKAVGGSPSRDRLRAVYRRLCDCLAQDRAFLPGEA